MVDKQKPKFGMLVEDETMVGGVLPNGAPCITPKTVEGKANESVDPTDAREKSE